ncbi:hypothetical protein PoB_007355600 [Plakobranchus ocellatus]|uniref:Uncharacterized protein n=1 Tax=Plakobranchus ocellatus TaxID=259542 RepID=A0AAV4DT43_9GAST|nr:hypothetical protein PoB_007355600 [Plakobranchus ocellatus]
MKLIVASVAICFFAVYANGQTAASPGLDRDPRLGEIAEDVKQEDVDEDIENFMENLNKKVKKIDEKTLRKIQAKLNAEIDAEVSEIEAMDRKEIPGHVMNLFMGAMDRLVNETKYEDLNKALKINLIELLNEAIDQYKSLSDEDLMDAIEGEALEVKTIINSTVDLMINQPDAFIDTMYFLMPY